MNNPRGSRVCAAMPVGIAGLALLLAAGCGRMFIYYPETAPENRLLALAHAQGMAPWRDAAGDIVGWRNVASPQAAGNRRAVAVFHGNAGYALHRVYFAHGFASLAPDEPWDVFLFEYPGYGARPGRPSEETIKTAAGDAVVALLDEGYRSVHLVGESLGSGVACHLAGTLPDRIDGLLLVAPFTTLKDVATHHFPEFLVGAVLRESYDNVEALRRYRGPVAVLLAEHDEVVPASLGQRLYDTYEGPKKLWVQKGRTHNTLRLESDAPLWREVREFWKDPT